MATEGSDQAEGQHSEEGSLPNVVDRRTVLKGAAAVGLFAVGIPAVAKRPTLATAPSAPSAASARDSGVKLWDGQQVLTPYGLSFQGTPKRGGYLKWAWLYEPVPQLDPQLPTSGSVGRHRRLLLDIRPADELPSRDSRQHARAGRVLGDRKERPRIHLHPARRRLLQRRSGDGR